MKKLLYSFAIAATLQVASATTVIPPTFQKLVGDAEVIFQGKVTNVRSMWVGEGAQRRIMTDVTFAVKESVKGNPGANYTMRMLGGTVGTEAMTIADAPKFKVGDENLLFVEHNGTQYIPLVGIMHGRMRVQHDQSGRDLVITDDGSPLISTQQLGKSAEPVAGAPMDVAQFKSEVRGELARLNRGLEHPVQ